MEKTFLQTKKVMLVDDEPDLLKMVSAILADDGFENIVAAATVKAAVNVCKEEKPDLLILDVMLPDGDGFSLMRQIRQFTNIPVIFLTAKDEAADKLAGLGLGADDYIVKPFLPQELLLRVYAILRRCYKEESNIIKLEGCTVDFSRAEVKRDGRTIPLTAKEQVLLETLARNEGKIVTLDALCEALDVYKRQAQGRENKDQEEITMYSEKVMDHFQNPRNVGEIENASGVGTVGNAKCGDIMRMYLDIDDDGIIRDCKFKTFGCGAAVATSSMATELVKGKTVQEALEITNKAVMEALDGLPPVKVHCSLPVSYTHLKSIIN